MESRKEFEKRMTEKYPLLYEDMYGDPRETIMSFGFDIGPGWYSIIEELSEGLEKLIKPIRDKAMADPKAKCARCCRGKKWHWFFYFIMSVKYFFTNKLRAVKLLPAEIKRAKFFKYSVWNRMKFSFLLLKWYRPCRRFVLSHPRALQVKEKFGSLRFYMTSNTDEIDDLIDKAEEKSYKTCEECGCPGKLRNGGWMTTLCDSCAKKKGYDLE